MTLVNLRGVRDSGTVFAVPTYLFLGSMLLLIGVGLLRALLGDAPDGDARDPAHPRRRDARGAAPDARVRRRLQRDHGRRGRVQRRPGVPDDPSGATPGRRSRSWPCSSAILFLGTSILALVAGAQPDPHETILSQLGRATFGSGPMYYVLQLSTMGILVLAANTAFADFPRLVVAARAGRADASRFAYRGERLAFSSGIIALAVLAIVVVAAFGGRVEALIPLYAVGVFTSITLSQLGMVVHWRRTRGPGWRRSLAVNGVGAVATAIVTLIFAAAKFALGAWLVIVVVPLLVLGMRAMERLYAGRRAADPRRAGARSSARRRGASTCTSPRRT